MSPLMENDVPTAEFTSRYLLAPPTFWINSATVMNVLRFTVGAENVWVYGLLPVTVSAAKRLKSRGMWL